MCVCVCVCVSVSGTCVWLKRQRTADTCQAAAAASCLGTRGERNDWRIIGFLPDAESRAQQGETRIVPPGIWGGGRGGTVGAGGQANSWTWRSCLTLTLFLPRCAGDDWANWLGEVAPRYYFPLGLGATPTRSFCFSQGHSSPRPAGLALTCALARVQPLEGRGDQPESAGSPTVRFRDSGSLG